MAGSAWEEVKGLAQDFQRLQHTAAAQRLSERNVVEMVRKCVENHLLDLCFTSDGKEYVTQEHLNKEILDDLLFHGGRRSLVDLATALNVSVSQIESSSLHLQKTRKGLHSVLGYLVTAQCLDELAQDFDRKLQQDGLLSISDLSKAVDLPPDFLLEQMNRRIGSIIRGKRDQEDPTLLYTQDFVNKGKAQLRGMLGALSQPCPVSNLLKRLPQLPLPLFLQLVGELIYEGSVSGTLSSPGKNGTFVPKCFSEAQMEYVDRFMAANGHVDVEVMGRMGIAEPRFFCQHRFPRQKLMFLETQILGEDLFQRMVESVLEGMETVGWCDLETLLPFQPSSLDLELLEGHLGTKDTLRFGTLLILSQRLKEFQAEFRPELQQRAQQDVEEGRYGAILESLKAEEKKERAVELNALEEGRSGKKEERRKKATGGKGGGGTQGRETKTKSTKKKYRPGKDRRDDSDSDEGFGGGSKSVGGGSKPVGGGGKKKAESPYGPFVSLRYFTAPVILEHLEKKNVLADVDQAHDVLKLIAEYLDPLLWDEYLELAKATQKAQEEAEREASTGSEEKAEVLEKSLRMLGLLELYAQGLEKVGGEAGDQLEKHLLRSLVQDLIDSVAHYFQLQQGLKYGQIHEMQDTEVMNGLLSLAKQKSARDVLRVCDTTLGLRSSSALAPRLEEAKEGLVRNMEKAEEGNDPALFLHATLSLLFALREQALLSTTGKFVPIILDHLVSKIPVPAADMLRKYQKAVVAHIRSKGTSGEVDNLYVDLKQLVKDLSKEWAKDAGKSAQSPL